MDSTLAADIEQFRLDRDTARDTYTPLLDPAGFNAADQATAVAAWEQAAGWAGQDPAAQAAPAQLDQQFRGRWNISPMDYQMDQVGDQQANRTEDERAQQARAVAGADLDQAAGLDDDRDAHLAAGETTDDPATRQQQFADAARSSASADALREDAEDLDLGGESETSEPAARYDRAAESDLDAPGVTDAARQARIESAPAFSRSLRDSLTHRTPGSASNTSAAAPTRNHSLSTEHDLGR